MSRVWNERTKMIFGSLAIVLLMMLMDMISR